MSKILFFGDKSVGNGILEYLKTTDEVVETVTNEHNEKTTWFPKIESKFTTWDPLLDSGLKIKQKPDWIVCAYYDKIIPNNVLKMARFGAVNIHLGLIQDYRGCYPTTFPIIDGKKEAGVTIHEMTSKIDGGKVFAQARVSVDNWDTGKSLYYKCTGAAVALFKEHWGHIKNGTFKFEITPSKKYHTRSEFPSHEINLKWPKEKIDRHVRAMTFPPFPRPFFVINGKKFEIVYE